MQTVGLLAELAIIGLLGLLAMVFGYVAGHKDGTKEGFNRGRAVSRHAAGREVSK